LRGRGLLDPRAKRRPFGIRQRVPRDRAPGFREHGKMVDRSLLKLVCALQKRYGQAYASEDGLRWMIYQDSGHMPGVGTVRAALRRLERLGIVAQWWLAPGELLPDGEPCRAGTRLVWWPVGRDVRRRLQARAASRNARQPHHTRTVGHTAAAALEQLSLAMAATAGPRKGAASAAAEAERAYRERVELSKRQLAELVAAEAARGPP
jgi:hypothetical protein